MNKTNFNQTGGFPLKTERLQELQTAFQILNAFGSLAGNLTIISGCGIVGSTVKNGFIYIDGELLEFREAGLTGTSRVIIIEEPVNRAFENGTVKNVYTIRYATFGTATTSWLWTDFKRPIETKAVETALLLKADKTTITAIVTRIVELEKKNAVFQNGGGMLFWNKPANLIPPGWQEVIDWRGRMPVGFDNTQTEFNTMGKTGGAKNKTLSVAEMPEHDHGLTQIKRQTGNNTNYPQSFYDQGWNVGSNLKTDKAGSGQAFSILNPYRVVMFIEYIG